MILPFREGFILRNFAYAKFSENKVLAKISEFTVSAVSFMIDEYIYRYGFLIMFVGIYYRVNPMVTNLLEKTNIQHRNR